MFLMFARFDFKSTDLAAEDKNYFDHHVRLARQLPGVRMYLTGRLAATAQGKPDRYRAVLFGYDTPAAGLASLDCPIGAEMMADSAEHIEGTVVDACQGEVIVPFDGRAPGQPCLVAVLMYDRAPSANESRWLKYSDSIRNLPGLCGYIEGPAFEARGERPDREWMEVRIFRPGVVGGGSRNELIALDESLARAPRAYCFEGEVQI
jgi:uncharacterized protein (TIGR02118 family)